MKPIIFIICIIKLVSMKIMFKELIAIILVSIILGIFRNYFISENNVSLIKENKTTTKMIEGIFDIPDFMTEPQIVNTDFVKHYFDNPIFKTKYNVIIVDARDKTQYETKHIQGAINIPYDNYEDYDNVLYDLPIDDIYIIYCNGGECTLSLDLAYVMYDEYDFETVFVYEEGLPIWEGNNYSVSSLTSLHGICTVNENN